MTTGNTEICPSQTFDAGTRGVGAYSAWPEGVIAGVAFVLPALGEVYEQIVKTDGLTRRLAAINCKRPRLQRTFSDLGLCIGAGDGNRTRV